MCWRHIGQIKRALQIANVASEQSAWAVAGDEDKEGAQIDLLIERKDNVVNMCEMKFYSEEFYVNSNYQQKLVHRTNLLAEQLPRKTIIHSILVTTYGLVDNEYSREFVDTVTISDLFVQ